MDYALTVLGSGTCVCDPLRYPAAYLIEVYSLSERWLLDLGSGCLQRLAEVGVSPFSIDRVFITHTHPDHIASYLPLMQALSFTPGQTQNSRIEFYYSEDVERVCSALRRLESQQPLPVSFGVTLLSSGCRTDLAGDASIRALEMEHSIPTLGFRFELGKHRLVFGADSGVCNNLVVLCENADLAILDCSFPRGCGTQFHTSTDDVARVALKANVRKIVLSHLYPAVGGLSSEEIIRQIVDAGYNGEIVVASDKLRVIS